MCFSRDEFHDHAFVREIDNHVENALNFHQDRPQFSHARVTIFAFGRDLDRFNDRVIGPPGIERITRFRFVWSCRIHQLLNAGRCPDGRNFSRNWLENSPDSFRQNLLAGGVRMDMVGLIQIGITTDAFE
jgi:hypothetical protein